MCVCRHTFVTPFKRLMLPQCNPSLPANLSHHGSEAEAGEGHACHWSGLVHCESKDLGLVRWTLVRSLAESPMPLAFQYLP